MLGLLQGAARWRPPARRRVPLAHPAEAAYVRVVILLCKSGGAQKAGPGKLEACGPFCRVNAWQPGWCCSPGGAVEPVRLPAVQVQALLPALVHKGHAAAERVGRAACWTLERGAWVAAAGGQHLMAALVLDRINAFL